MLRNLAHGVSNIKRLVSVLGLIAVVSVGLIVVKNYQALNSQPNVILINLDDADIDLLDTWAIDKYFPSIRKYIPEEGTRFSNFHVVAPVCGPSRGALYRGQYAHNTAIEDNKGGFEVFYNRGYTDSEIGMWMKDAGYQTALVGKYCHTEYPQASRDMKYVPPGWDNFNASLGGRYFGVSRNVDGRRAMSPDALYRTDIERDAALTILREHNPEKPLFLYIAPFAPHMEAETSELGMVASRHKSAFLDIRIPATPDLNESDVSDKPPLYAALPKLTEKQLEEAHKQYRDRIRSMLAVDEFIAELFTELEQGDWLDDTYIFFTSDNGFQLGHHRLLGKKDHFDRVTRVQLIVRGPGIKARETVNHLIGHIDLIPTFLELAKSVLPTFLDGKSFLPLLNDSGAHDKSHGSQVS